MSLPAQPQSLAPAQVFICRHGARLDASDPVWHLTSPTPYDPPLTYGGWTQARTLGNRIATHILSQISSEYPVSGSPAPKPAEKGSTWSAGPKETKKEAPPPTIPSISPAAASKLGNTKVIIHTSPFLRCVQTSIAVTAGMSQYFSDINVKTVTPDGSGSSTGASTGVTSKLVVHPRPMLRVDGFLSEWLCEDYFTDITPPPATDLMVGTAKIDLMRPSSASGLRKDKPIISQPSQTLISPPHHHSHHRAHSVGFVPPVATSAIGKNEPIPRGHVSHAKEFIDIDYAYDSLRYGDGGEYGEEWGRMHKRVKIGFEKIVKDYADGEIRPCLKSSSTTSFEQLAAAQNAGAKGGNAGSKSTESTEAAAAAAKDIPGSTIMIFVSHGAICNALIGAMTHKPVLMDMGIASMSMGILIPSSTTATTAPTASSGSQATDTAPVFQLPGFGGISAAEDLNDSEDPLSFSTSSSFTPYTAPPPQDASSASGIPQYDVKITASTDHLRTQAGSQVKSPPQGPKHGPSSSSTPPLRPRKPSIGGSSFSMYNTVGRLPAPLIGSAGSSAVDSSASGGGVAAGGSATGLFTGGRAMGMVFGAGNASGSGGSGHAIGVRRTASAAAATRGLWSLPPAAEMERGSSDEGAVLTDEESGEEKKADEEVGKKEPKGADGAAGAGAGGSASASGSSTGSKVERKGSMASTSNGGMRVGGMGGGGGSSKPGGGKPGLWSSGANADRRRRWTVTNQNDEAGAQ
ncbi:hypothetical protein TWF106_005854 [Orbilia oligospora]|uniref:Phosphoglycerate mutase family protein n=1 Tax=Orbilia oligospora TaxID=2813651 RepID=A0A7C8QTF4_ORBOL|nr:hypothetical protein TWF106_005854 [Orbilia oligospora]